MSSFTIALSALTVLVLAAVSLAVAAFYQSRLSARAAREPQPGFAAVESASRALRADLDGLAAQVHALQEVPSQSPVAPAAPRNGMNLAKRSQALRLHRHGNSTSQIASLLDIPVQEVELLVKVHQIVLSNLPN